MAGRTQDSVGQIREVIEAIQQGTTEVSRAVSESSDKANIAIAQVGDVTGALKTIGDEVDQIAHMGIETARAATEQSLVIKEILRNASDIRAESLVITEQAVSSEQMSAELNGLSVEQSKIVQQFIV